MHEPSPRPPTPRPGPAQAQAHADGHFGEWLQGRLGARGALVLVSMRCPALGVTVRHGAGDAAARALDRALLPAPRRLRLARQTGLRLPAWVTVTRAPPPGAGAGSSTAALVALARLAGHAGTAANLARACVRAEGASDPLMFPGPDRLLFAPRLGRVVERMAPPPRCTVIGGFLGAGQRTDPGDLRFPDIADLLPAWRRAARAGDLATAARIATISAARTLALRGPIGDPTADLAAHLGAMGWAIAHTGSARALIFPPGAVPAGAAEVLARAGFADVITFTTGGA